MRSIAAAPVIATGLRVSPLLTPLRLDSADGCVGKKRVRQDTVPMTKEHAVPTRANERSAAEPLPAVMRSPGSGAPARSAASSGNNVVMAARTDREKARVRTPSGPLM